MEQAKKRDHKIIINDIAISRVAVVPISDFSSEQQYKMMERHRELLKIAHERNNDNEVLLIDDLSFSSEVCTLGEEFKVSPGSNPFAVSVITNAPRQSLIYMHNHPSTNNFSIGDIDTFICEAAIKTMSVVTNQGEVYIINKTINYSFEKARNLMKKTYDSFSENDIDNKEFVKRFLKHSIEGGIEYGKS